MSLSQHKYRISSAKKRSHTNYTICTNRNSLLPVSSKQTQRSNREPKVASYMHVIKVPERKIGDKIKTEQSQLSNHTIRINEI
ncbi:hypothetical protein EUTSA_v10028010mg [Eutrema salsugineum]|uniref:Uncharacterized protein n=1 Tax=Eutrema salsugineum TaxID=72664 RepID=V4LST1_EUTSA|nr:hypothetical protein EUTSA_v10028010mg [Eutrema salsugineum]